jgi:hypothetical protein
MSTTTTTTTTQQHARVSTDARGQRRRDLSDTTPGGRETTEKMSGKII